MEAYTPGGSASRATLTFLQAWTQRLHVLGYLSGVYSSSASGIADLASELGTGYTEPDDVWTANWNGEANSADPYLPSERMGLTSASTSTAGPTTRPTAG